MEGTTERKGRIFDRAPAGEQDQDLEVGPCLMVRAYLGGTPLPVILDSGAGVSIVGGRFVGLYKETFSREPPLKPIKLTVTGIHSAAALSAS